MAGTWQVVGGYWTQPAWMPTGTLSQSVRNEGHGSRLSSRFRVSQVLDRHGPYVLPLLVGRLADTVTTLYGLTIAGVYERNVFVALLIEEVGPAGAMLVANCLSIAIVMIAVEWGVVMVAREGVPGDRRVTERVIVEFGYLPAIGLSFAAAAYNLGVIASV